MIIHPLYLKVNKLFAVFCALQYFTLCASWIYLRVSLQVLGFCFSVLHVQHVLVARVIIRAEQIGQGVVKLC